MTLTGKNALVFAATGAIARTVAHKFAAEGATVYLSGRSANMLKEIAHHLIEQDGEAETAIVDATDPAAVTDYVNAIAAKAGSVDIVFNGIGGRPADLGYPAPSPTQNFEDFLKPLRIILGSTFLTSRAAGAQMMRQGSGSIVTLSATLTGMTAANMANISATCGAIEALTRSLAGEFGPAGVRVNCVRGSAMPETRTIQETGAGLGKIYGLTEPPPPIGFDSPLRRPITVAETAAAVAFLASDAASGMTGQVITVCAGQFVG